LDGQALRETAGAARANRSIALAALLSVVRFACAMPSARATLQNHDFMR
jgi:hypothetical protein